MKKQTIEIDFIEFEDIQLGDVFTLEIGYSNDDYRVIAIEKDRIILHNEQDEEDMWIDKEKFENYFNLLAENIYDYYKVLSIHRLGTIWQSVENQCIWKIDRDY